MTQEALKLAFKKVTGIPDAWTNPALMQARNGFIQGWEAKEALAQTQEPVAWLEPEWGEKICPEVGYEVTMTDDHPRDLCWIPLYAHPPQGEPVALQDDEIYDAAFSAYCRGENSRELFRIMWSNRLTCSIGWDRDELKSFARNIAALYTHQREKNQ